MQIPNGFKQSTLDAFIEIYKNDVRDLQLWVVNCLNPEDVAVGSDGSIAVASHYSKTFIPIACEIMLFVQSSLIEKAMTRPEIFDNETLAKLKASFGNEAFYQTGAEWGLSESSFANRIDEYVKCTYEKIATGVSFPDGIEALDSVEGRKTGMLADCVVAQGILKKLEPYEKVKMAAKDAKEGDIAVGVGNAGLKMYRDMITQTFPHLSGMKLMERNNKGLCPCCGGTYKGLFTKRCSKCGVEKEEAEAFTKAFVMSPFRYPLGVYN